MHGGRGTPRRGARPGDARGRRAAPRHSAPLGSPMERPAEPRPPSDPLRRTYPQRGPPAAAGLSAGRGGGEGLGPGMGVLARRGARGAVPARGRARRAFRSGTGRWAPAGVSGACSGVPKAKLSASASSAQKHPEARSQRLLPPSPRSGAAPLPARCPSSAGLAGAAARSPPGAQGRAGLAAAPPGRPSQQHGALPPSERTERRGALPIGGLPPPRTVPSLCFDAGLTRF